MVSNMEDDADPGRESRVSLLDSRLSCDMFW